MGGREAGADVTGSRTIAAMADRTARRDLALLAVTVVGLSRLMEPPAVWLVAVLLLVAMLFGTLQVLADEIPPTEAAAGVPIESLILPAVAAVGCLGAIRLVPFGLWLVPAMLVTGLLVARSLAIEARIQSSPEGLSVADRTSLVVTMLIVAFVGFTGVAAMVPGGLVQPSADGTVTPLSETYLVVLAAGDAIIAFLLGYRAAALRVISMRDALWSALTYAGAIAIVAAALRAIAIPRLMAPALLTLAFYLWDAFHGASPARRRDANWIWQTILLAGLGVMVVAWNLLLRG
jgi:hypothetical protein